MIEYVQGSLFDHLPDDNCVIAHIVNDQKGWGRGFSGEISKRWPRAETAYRRWTSDFALGEVQFVAVETVPDRILPKIFVANMLAQHGYRSRFNPQPCKLDALDICLKRLRGFTSSGLIYRVLMPKIGTGLGGQQWDDIRLLIERNLDRATVFDYEGGVPSSTS
jgi:O-acetyl-ADP-ribose deacetylase (regulator of RNase III)